MMKLWGLFLLVLPALSSAGLQDIIKNCSRHKNVSTLNPAAEDRIPVVISNRTIQTHRLFSPMLRRKRQTRPPNFMFDGSTNLKWQTWNGSLPNQSVSIYNNYVGRYEYICSCNCEAGFYNPDMGPYCHYPNENKELRSNTFEILVNKDNFEVLEWQDGSYGSVPPYSVKTCSKGDVYVGKNDYGLGKVHVKQEVFYLPWKGAEYWYRSYQVLTYNDDIYSEHISNVQYKTNMSTILEYPPETVLTTAMTNNNCNPVLKSATLSKTFRFEKRWDSSGSSTFGIKKTFSGGIPGIGAGVEISAEVSFQFSGGETVTEESTHSTSVELTVPPNHYCRAKMVGFKYKADIPFTAHLSRTYRNGETTKTLISGRFNSVQMGEVRIVVERCQLIDNAQPC